MKLLPSKCSQEGKKPKCRQEGRLEKGGCRRQIDNLKDAMNAEAMASNGGVPAKKIASEVDRQYILADEQAEPQPPHISESTGGALSSQAPPCFSALPF
jgi:hypothetical protein